MEKFKIAMVCPGIDRFTAGSFLSTLRFAKLLAKKGHKVILISSKYPGDNSIEIIEDVKVYRLPSFAVPATRKKLYVGLPNRKKIKQILSKEEIDILHFMLPTPMTYSAIKAAKQLNLKIVAHSHTQPENFTYLLPNYLKIFTDMGNIVSYKILASLYNRSDTVICPTEFSRRLIISRGLRKKTEVISNGVDRNVFRKINPKGYEKKFGCSDNTVRVLFVGRLDPEKNIPNLIKAVPHIEKKFKNFEIYIVGGYMMREKLEKLSREMHVQHKVKFLGRVSEEDLIGIYNFSSIFVLPSLIELEGMAVLEAMSCGKPVVIANAKESAAKFFVSRNGFLFSPNNEKDLAEKMLLLMKNEKLRKKMGDESHKIAENFDINKSVIDLEKVYSRLS